jgi:hypothetical protein
VRVRTVRIAKRESIHLGVLERPLEAAKSVAVVPQTSIARVVQGNRLVPVKRVQHVQLGSTRFHVDLVTLGTAFHVEIVALDIIQLDVQGLPKGLVYPAVFVQQGNTSLVVMGHSPQMACVPAAQHTLVPLDNTRLVVEDFQRGSVWSAPHATLDSIGWDALEHLLVIAPNVHRVHPHSTGIFAKVLLLEPVSRVSRRGSVLGGRCSGSTHAQGITNWDLMGQCSTLETLPCQPCLVTSLSPLAPPQSMARPSRGACRSGLWGLLVGMTLWLEGRVAPMP